MNLCRSGQSVCVWELSVECVYSFLFGWRRWREQISRSWTTEWRPVPSRSRWSDASRGSRTIQSCGPQCNAMSGCTFCRTPSWCMRQCPANVEMRQSEWQCAVVVAASWSKNSSRPRQALEIALLYAAPASIAFRVSSSARSGSSEKKIRRWRSSGGRQRWLRDVKGNNIVATSAHIDFSRPPLHPHSSTKPPTISVCMSTIQKENENISSTTPDTEKKWKRWKQDVRLWVTVKIKFIALSWPWVGAKITAGFVEQRSNLYFPRSARGAEP